jgi:hypothetical protein
LRHGHSLVAIRRFHVVYQLSELEIQPFVDAKRIAFHDCLVGLWKQRIVGGLFPTGSWLSLGGGSGHS